MNLICTDFYSLCCIVSLYSWYTWWCHLMMWPVSPHNSQSTNLTQQHEEWSTMYQKSSCIKLPRNRRILSSLVSFHRMMFHQKARELDNISSSSIWSTITTWFSRLFPQRFDYFETLIPKLVLPGCSRHPAKLQYMKLHWSATTFLVCQAICCGILLLVFSVGIIVFAAVLYVAHFFVA